MICTKCNFQNEESAKFCRECGASLFTIKTCPKCNFQGGEESRFCKNCGTKLVEKPIKQPEPPKAKESEKMSQTNADEKREKPILDRNIIVAIVIMLVGMVVLAVVYFMFKDSKDTPKKGDVYVVGHEGDIVKLWKNGVAQNLTDGTMESRGSANSVFVSGNDVYVAGYEETGYYEQYECVAKLWKNGIAQNLSDGTKHAKANSVFVSGNDVYVVGYETNTQSRPTKDIPILWKNGVAQNLIDESTGGTTANSVFVSGSNVYVAGITNNGYFSERGAWFNRLNAIVWKNGVAQNFTDGNTYSEAHSVFVLGNDVYVAGASNGRATLWENGIEQKLVDETIFFSGAYSVFVSGSDVYVAGYERISVPKLWKNGVAQNLTDGNRGPMASSVYVSGSDVYVAGAVYAFITDTEAYGACATIWKNGVATRLTDGSTDASANSVFVVE